MAVMEKQYTALEAVKLVEEAAAKHKDKKGPVIRKLEKVAVNQGARQGDLYIMRVQKADKKGHTFKITLPRGVHELTIGKAWEGNQLAPGTNGGSRHICASKDTAICNVQASGPSRVLFGPLMRCCDKEGLKIEHPEHDHLHMPPGDYITIYQMDARTLQRVQD
jgi:hypothetical protein